MLSSPIHHAPVDRVSRRTYCIRCLSVNSETKTECTKKPIVGYRASLVHAYGGWYRENSIVVTISKDTYRTCICWHTQRPASKNKKLSFNPSKDLIKYFLTERQKTRGKFAPERFCIFRRKRAARPLYTRWRQYITHSSSFSLPPPPLQYVKPKTRHFFDMLKKP